MMFCWFVVASLGRGPTEPERPDVKRRGGVRYAVMPIGWFAYGISRG